MELTTEMLEGMGQALGESFHEYQVLIEEDERQRELLRLQIKNKKKKKKLRAQDIAKACTIKQEQQIRGFVVVKQPPEDSPVDNIDFSSSGEEPF